jgi:hypothetical protein
MATGSTGYLPSIDYTARDYEQIRAALVQHVQNFFPNDWQDFGESNLGMCILELVAYVGDQLSFYLDRVVNEMFLPTVVQRANAVNLVNLLGYVPRTTAASVAPIQMTLDVAQTGTTTVPAYTTFTDNAGNVWEFLENIEIPAARTDTVEIQVTNEVAGTATVATTYTLALDQTNLVTNSFSINVTIGGISYPISSGTDGVLSLPYGGYGLVDFVNGSVNLTFAAAGPPTIGSSFLATYQWTQPIKAYQGETKLEQFQSSGNINQSFTITTTPVLLNSRVLDDTVTPDPNRFEVWIGDPGAPYGTGTGTQWLRVNTLVTASGTEQVFAVELDDQDNVTIVFGDNLNGAAPAAGTINVIYRSGGGSAGNVSTGFINTSVTGLIGLFATTVTVYNNEPSSGGADRESLDEIRINAPAYFKTNDTATTEEDFDALALYTQAGLGNVTRAKSRLTPAESLTTKTVHTDLSLGTVPVSQPLEYYFLLPGAPIPVGTNLVTLTYSVGGVIRTVNETDLGSGLANFTGDATIDSTNTRWRYDTQDVSGETPATWTGDGTTVEFTGTLAKPPPFPASVLLHYTIPHPITGADVNYVGYDDGSGNIVGTNIHADSSINYATGAIAVYFGDPAELTSGNAETYDLDNINASGQTNLYIVVDGGAPQVINFVAGDFANYAACTAAEIVAVLTTGGLGGGGNALSGATASVSGTSVKITSDTYGATSSVDVNAGANDANDATDGFDFSLTIVNGTSYAPKSGYNITWDYQSCLHLVLNFAPDVGEEFLLTCETGPTTQELPTNNIEVYTWTTGPDDEFVAPSSALRDNLKTYLDLRRVLATSVEVLPGKLLKLNYYLTVEFDPSVSSSETSAAIVTALETYFADVVNINAGVDVPIAAIYDAVYPVSGVLSVVCQDVGLRVEVGEGNGTISLFRDDSSSPGEYLDTSRLPVVSGTASSVKVYQGSTQIGYGDTSSPTITLQGSGGAVTLLAGSYLHESTGDFVIKVTPAPGLGEKIYLDFMLDEQAAADGMSLWNISVDEWEIATLGDVYINGSKVN